jgi:hypothetical protein
MFEDLILGHNVKKVEKGADVVDFEFRDGMLRRVDPMLNQPGGNPKPTDATRSPQNPASAFPGGAMIVDRPVRDSDDSVMPLAGYDFTEPAEQDLHAAGTLTPHFLNVGEDEVVEPANYRPSNPGNRPQGPAPADMSDAAEDPTWRVLAVKVGDSYVLRKSASGEFEAI